MKLADIRKMQDRMPFRPFNVHLASGEVLPVVHPEQMSLPSGSTDLFVLWTAKDWNLLEAAQVIRLSTEKKTHK
jgi:hypothetical protein